MKTIDTAAVSSVGELLDLAKDEMVLLTTPEGREFILTEVDDLDERDFEAEVEAISRNPELLSFLEQRSRENRRIPLSEAKKRLGLD